MAKSVLAIDVDLCRVHAFSSKVGRVCYEAPDFPFQSILEHDLVLVEVASPVCTSRSEAEDYNRRKWAIGNSFMVGRLDLWRAYHPTCPLILAAPANVWTLGHKEVAREVAAGCFGQDNHDIRACRCMLFYHGNNPDKWKPLDQFLQGLRKPHAADSKPPARSRKARRQPAQETP